ncbi:uncharacterized protein VICG_01576, partial [Vittaforma corneae ATCC 50505]
MAKIDKKAQRETIHAEKSRIAIKNMGYKDSSPPLVSIVGPKMSGKTTLLNSMVAHYWKAPREFAGPVTMSIRNRKHMLCECQSDIERVIDAIKVSDMIVFVVNLRIGLQKDTLEAIGMMNNHGVPKFCFVLTNYDQKISSKAVKDVEVRLQKEFSFPVKFFCLRTAEDNREHYENIRHFMRYIETMKYRPVEWRCVHPYVVVDRMRGETAFGYVRGGPIGKEVSAHIPGHGDVEITDIEVCSDPLGSRSNVFYSVLEETNDNEAGEESGVDSIFLEESSGRTSLDMEGESSHSDDNGSDLSMLKKRTRHRFKPAVSDEEGLAERFNEEYSDDKNSPGNVLEKMKSTELSNQRKVEECQKLIIPGTYVRFNLHNTSLDPTNLIVVGTYLPTEGTNILLKGKVSKNKWQTFDLKSNAPYFFSVGWCRFQSVPVFCRNGRFSKYCREFSEILFYGPSVPLGSSFFIYSYDADYKILGAGQILDISGRSTVKKKLKLIGHPRAVLGQNVVVQSMFSTSKEASRFVNARLSTASGLRGLIKSAVGKDGCVRAAFEGSVLMSETIFLKCLVPVEPLAYLQHTTPSAEYVRHLKDLGQRGDEPSSCSEDTSI